KNAAFSELIERRFGLRFQTNIVTFRFLKKEARERKQRIGDRARLDLRGDIFKRLSIWQECNIHGQRLGLNNWRSISRRSIFLLSRLSVPILWPLRARTSICVALLFEPAGRSRFSEALTGVTPVAGSFVAFLPVVMLEPLRIRGFF